MLDYTKDLNPEQLKVVTSAEGPCLVLAGAGSGKTRVITYRVAYLLEKGVKPENILLVTFTNKAAREMVGRVAHLTPYPSPCKGEGNSRPSLLPWSGTFHHIAYKVLKKYCSFLNYKNKFSVLDSDDSLNLIKQCLKDEGIDRTVRRFPSPAVLQSIISYARNAETTIEDVLDLKHPHFLQLADTIKNIADNYEKKKKAANVMDFDDLLVNWLKLLEQSEKIRQKHQEQFQYILVDEYQDTNKIQASIIKILAAKHGNLLVVGDDAQSIYSFRAAEIKNILEFEKDYPRLSGGQAEAKIFRLETNYRSTPEILNLANDIISNNINQYQKELRSAQDKFVRPEVCSFDNGEEEAVAIADRAEELLSEGIEPRDIAVLFRAAHHSQALEMELMKRGIAYDYRGGVRFFERAHVKDVLAYLRILNNPTDEIAWRRVLNMQVGIGEATIEAILGGLRTTDHGLHLSNIPVRAQVGWNDFLQIFRPLQNAADAGIGDLIRIIMESKYQEYLENEYPDYRERLQDLEQLAAFADKVEDLDTFLAESSLQENFRGVSVETQNFASLHDGKIILSTIHQAKGLEWKAVFIINVSNGQFPNERAMREDGGLEEERRLFYVAVTRAKKHLHVSYLLSGAFGGSAGGPSFFLEEINKDLVDGDVSVPVFDNDEPEEIIYVDEEKPKRSFKPGSFLRSVDEL
ncbi:MAG: ATP-dependent helicase [Candidatus Magasanikbacteria bacterium]|nr:ATP-dependent helicase [Candidatus Magasanikbacteria bacterium]